VERERGCWWQGEGQDCWQQAGWVTCRLDHRQAEPQAGWSAGRAEGMLSHR